MLRFRTATAGVILLGIFALHGADAANIPVLSVCQALRDPARYAGKNVIIFGYLVSTDEGSWLNQDCGTDLVIEGRRYPTTISAAYSPSEFAPPPAKPAGFKWDKPLLKRALEEVKKTTRLQSGTKWYAVYGRLETAPTRSIVLANGRAATTVGYGHLGYAPAQIIANVDCWLKLR